MHFFPSCFLNIDMKVYKGNIEPSENTVFVFGSNPEGRHGAGAAKIAKEKFGAIYGQGEGLQGNSYAIPTKDLRIKENNGFRSIPEEKIINSIKKLYSLARERPDLNFKISYRNTHERSLNGYTGLEMMKMFLCDLPVPSNIWISEEWADFIRENAREDEILLMGGLYEG